MVSIVKRHRGSGDYYYLYHDYKGDVRRQYEEYLGKSIPPDVDERKNDFMLRILRSKWEPKLDRIRVNFERDNASMPQTILEKNLAAFAVRFTYNTQRIEGSTLSLKDTALLLEDGITPVNKPISDVLEAMSHKSVFFDAINEMNMTWDRVAEWHRNQFEVTKKDIAGKIRDYNVRISQSKFMPPSHRSLGTLVGAFFDWYERNKSELNPVELAALVHLKFVTIHPFGDGNGRISRLMMNHVLYRSGYPMLDIRYGDRRSYYNALERSQTKSADWIFLQWFMKRYIRTYL